MPEDAFHLLNQYIKVSRETFERLSLYHELLLKWQSSINLVGPDTIPYSWERHFLDSLQLANSIPDLSKIIIDMGSGAGFPGMPLAIYGAANVHIIESDAKKIVFLQEVARITNTTAFIHHCRIEGRPIDCADIILSRACSSLDQLLLFSSLYVSHETISLFHKGKNYSKEIVEAKEHWSFNHTIIPSVTDAQGVILKLTDLRKRGYDKQ